MDIEEHPNLDNYISALNELMKKKEIKIPISPFINCSCGKPLHKFDVGFCAQHLSSFLNVFLTEIEIGAWSWQLQFQRMLEFAPECRQRLSDDIENEKKRQENEDEVLNLESMKFLESILPTSFTSPPSPTSPFRSKSPINTPKSSRHTSPSSSPPPPYSPPHALELLHSVEDVNDTPSSPSKLYCLPEYDDFDDCNVETNNNLETQEVSSDTKVFGFSVIPEITEITEFQELPDFDFE